MQEFFIDKKRQYECVCHESELGKIYHALTHYEHRWIVLTELKEGPLNSLIESKLALEYSDALAIVINNNRVFWFGAHGIIQEMLDIYTNVYGERSIKVLHYAPHDNPLRTEIYYPYCKEPIFEKADNKQIFAAMYDTEFYRYKCENLSLIFRMTYAMINNQSQWDKDDETDPDYHPSNHTWLSLPQELTKMITRSKSKT